VLALAITSFASASAVAAPGWGKPFRLAGPAALDVIPAETAFAPDDSSTIAYGIENIDNSVVSSAYAVARSARGQLGRPRQVGGLQQILDLAYDGDGVELLGGASERGEPCCSTAVTLRSAQGGGFAGTRRIVKGLAGATQGRFVSLPDRLLAVVATEHGVWVSQSASGGRFPTAHRLTAGSALPEAMDATSLRSSQSVVVWTARPNSLVPAPTQIFFSTGSAKRAPRGARVAITVPAGHRIDELAVARAASWPTVAWIESWFDTAGAFHSATMVADLRGVPRPQALSSPSELAAGLSLSADDRGDQVLSWKGCNLSGSCAVRAVRRPAHGRFTTAAQLPAVDASQIPAVAVAANGTSLLAWVQQGHVVATQATRNARAFAGSRLVSSTNYAADLALAFGPKNQALATWTQGTLAQSVMGAVFKIR
jgi:hypothetical protein